MPGKVAKIGSFSEWVGIFNEWRKEVGVDKDDVEAFHFDTLYGAIETEEIQFGYYKGRNKWENLRQIPTQAMRDALMNMIIYQGDTEFASVEQQRNLFATAPTEWDRRAITRVMIEEMRHGWQMCALLIDFFGSSGKVEAQKMLERRAFENKRLLGTFNVDVDNWLDFFTYTDFVDRDGKFQLQMLKYSSFAPLGRSTSYMLREEAFHMGTGHDGLRRVVERRDFIPLLCKHRFYRFRVIERQRDRQIRQRLRHTRAVGLPMGERAAARLDKQGIDMAVVAALELHDPLPPRETARQPDARHGRLGAAVHHAHFLDAGDPFANRLRHFDLIRIRNAEADSMVRRLFDRADHDLRGMTQDRRPPRADVINILVAIDVPDAGARGMVHEKRFPPHPTECPHRRVHPAGDRLQRCFECPF